LGWYSLVGAAAGEPPSREAESIARASARGHGAVGVRTRQGIAARAGAGATPATQNA
jgi:hypothetical protein